MNEDIYCNGYLIVHSMNGYWWDSPLCHGHSFTLSWQQFSTIFLHAKAICQTFSATWYSPMYRLNSSFLLLLLLVYVSAFICMERTHTYMMMIMMMTESGNRIHFVFKSCTYWLVCIAAFDILGLDWILHV